MKLIEMARIGTGLLPEKALPISSLEPLVKRLGGHRCSALRWALFFDELNAFGGGLIRARETNWRCVRRPPVRPASGLSKHQVAQQLQRKKTDATLTLNRQQNHM
jgi:hypothetical protein